LPRLGRTKTVLLERDELTSGSTWHAAANIHGLHDVTSLSRPQHYPMKLYKQLEAKSVGRGARMLRARPSSTFRTSPSTAWHGRVPRPR